ncbi:MAG: NAD(P)-dependent oxidoreductase [Candidatus Latescibacteria bacterium]|jgi:nucleoside-diphosphate-sugar epimerase|nr:NAD(P)-dependent oxidoreductase [Candidatus Latescibacterota bacterium]
MKILLVGGSGHVGTFVTPYLLEHHTIRVLDVSQPRSKDVEYIEGSITDPEALARALDGMDTFITMVMKSGQGGFSSAHSVEQAIDNYSVNCLGLHLLLHTAVASGIKQGVCTSTMSVHNRARTWYPSEADTPLDPPNVYGLTKQFGEEICAYFAREFDMNLAVLRITGPSTRAQYLDRIKNPPGPPKLYYTDEEDLANAYLAAVEFVRVGHGRSEVFFISGDADHEEMNMSKGEALLGWVPKAQNRVK